MHFVITYSRVRHLTLAVLSFREHLHPEAACNEVASNICRGVASDDVEMKWRAISAVSTLRYSVTTAALQAVHQGLTLLHLSAQLEPCLTQ